jgi:pimeloyl-ACP methyl ester carboxylesterase
MATRHQRSWWRGASLALIVAGLAAGAWLLAVANGAFEISLDELETRYRKSNSQFIEIDGVRMHYVDEGQGPAVILVHASFMSLHTWDALAASLANRYRVVRFDMLTNGLTGFDPQQRYSIERNVELLDRLTTQLGIDRYALVGTSSGGTVAFLHASARPERVTRLVLINSAGMPRSAATNPNRGRGSALSQWMQRHYKSRAWWQDSLEQQFTGGTPPPDDLVQRVYDMNRRRGLVEASAIFMRDFRTGDPETTLGRVRAPTFIGWSIGNLTVSHLEADVFEHWLTQAPSIKRKYAKLGHYAYLESADEINSDIGAFLDGTLDGQLRVTRRVTPNDPANSAAPTNAP